MLLKKMLESPSTSPNLVIFDPFQSIDREALVREVVGLANARVEGPRSILFGVNPGALNGNKVVGISEDVIGDLKRAHRLVSNLVEPVLDLAFIFDQVNGKLVGALEIDGCEFGPYFLAQDLSDACRRGACWIRNGLEVVEVDRRTLLNGDAAPARDDGEALASYSPEDVKFSVGFNDDPDCEFIEVDVPDTSDPPFAEDGEISEKTRTSFTQALKETVGTVTTRIMNLGQSKSDNPEDAGKEIAEAARRHYFYEERAVKVDLSICNESDLDIKDLSVQLGFPKLPGLDVADRIYTSPFDKRSEAEVKQLRYPDVERRDDRTIIRTMLGFLPAGSTQTLLATPLRLAVGPEALGRKVAMQYVLRGPDGKRVCDGKLKIRFGKLPEGGDDGAGLTYSRSLDDE